MSVLTNFALDCLLSLYGLIIYLTSLSLYSRYSSSRDPRVLKVRDVDQWIGKLKVTRIALNLSLLGVLLFLAPMALFVRLTFRISRFLKKPIELCRPSGDNRDSSRVRLRAGIRRVPKGVQRAVGAFPLGMVVFPWTP